LNHELWNIGDLFSWKQGATFGSNPAVMEIIDIIHDEFVAEQMYHYRAINFPFEHEKHNCFHLECVYVHQMAERLSDEEAMLMRLL